MSSNQKTGGASRRLVAKLTPRLLIEVIVGIVLLIIGINIGEGRISISYPWDQSPVAKSLPAHLDYSTINQVYDSLKQNYDGQLTEKQLLDGLKHGLAEATNDPYTEYFTPKEASNFNNELNNAFSGIGAELSKNSDGYIEIIAPISGTPASQAGLQAGDILTSINGQTTNGMSVDTAVTKIRGQAGTKVTLGIVRNMSQSLTFTITRQSITVPSVMTKILPGNIGYMQISTFADDTTDLTQQAASTFKHDNVKGVILDLRDDPGGLLDAAVHTSSLWLSPGQLILQEKRGTTVVQSYSAIGPDLLHGLPTVILINGGSASASEITTGALHDNNQAYVIGQKSFGKGVVQQLINFGDGSQLKVTVASWYRPDGKNINHLGITPDKTINESESDISNPNNINPSDAQLQAAEDYINAH